MKLSQFVLKQGINDSLSLGDDFLRDFLRME
ncbi:MAG: hypothetical protein AWU54_1804 [Candidatus Frackibacter sp. T328-2]|nr:MAG: hypothetical protein AWU54_1804 [Candidatus Frackibacter sp. T328-2]